MEKDFPARGRIEELAGLLRKSGYNGYASELEVRYQDHKHPLPIDAGRVLGGFLLDNIGTLLAPRRNYRQCGAIALFAAGVYHIGGDDHKYRQFREYGEKMFAMAAAAREEGVI